MYELALALGVTIALIAAGVTAERYLRQVDPLLSVSSLTKTLVLGTALGGPFALESLGLLPVGDAGGWDLIAALALSLVLYIPAARLVGIAGGIGSTADGTGC